MNYEEKVKECLYLKCTTVDGIICFFTDTDTSSVEKRITQALQEAYDAGLEEAAKEADRTYNGFYNPHEYSEDVAHAIRALKSKGGE
jgi:hypothetical protein